MPAHQASVGGLRGLLEHAAGATLPDWASASAAIEVRHVAAGEPVFRQDEPHPFVYLVSRGLVKLLYLDEAGNEWIKSFSQEGRYFASISALTPGGSTSLHHRRASPCSMRAAWRKAALGATPAS